MRVQLQRAFLTMLVPLLVVTLVGGFLLNTSGQEFRRTSALVARGGQITEVLNRLAQSGRTLSELTLHADRVPILTYLSVAPQLDKEFTSVVGQSPPDGVPAARVALGAWRDLWHTLERVERLTRAPAARLAPAAVVLYARIADLAVVSSQHLDEVAAATARAQQDALQNENDRERLQELLLVLSAALGLAVGLLASRRLHRRARGQLDDLSKAAAQLGSGDDPEPVPLGNTSELRSVGEAFNQMAARVRASRAELVHSERRFRSLVQNSSDVVMLVDADAVIRYLSPSASAVLGVEPEAMTGRPLSDLLDPDDAPLMLAALVRSRPRCPSVPVACRLVRGDGSSVATETLVVDLTTDPAVGGFVLTSRDVSERKTLEDRLRHQAFHDELTGLPNRALLRERLTHRLERRADAADSLVAVLFVDLDDFKTINDSLGHLAGDELLRAVSRRISSRLRSADTAARVGGDEFVVLLEDLADRAEAHEVAGRLMRAVRKPLLLQGREVFPQASVGIAIVPPHVAGSEEVLSQADMAMYHAKSEESSIAEYQPRLAERARRRLALKSDLQRAIQRHEFEVHYQPIIKLDGREVVGAEALVRWRHPTRGLLLPAEFLALSEETGLIVPLGALVLRQACRQAAVWSQRPGWEGVSVNIPVRHFMRPGFPAEVSALLAETYLPPEQLVLELTESALLHQEQGLFDRLAALRATGVRLAIDDFGSGYSSLGYLRRLDVDIVKIDKSFVDRVHRAGRDVAVVRAVIELGRALGLATVAEGVELPEQADALQALECGRAQGFLFAPALAPADMPEPDLQVRGQQGLPARA
ncbi:MAG: EAL domain-containing protein [Frankiaceae bacterium]